MDGLRFVRGDHLSVGEGVYLPSADIVGLIWKHLTEATPKALRAYTPDLLKSDFFYIYDEAHSLYGLFASVGSSASLPTWGSQKDFFGPHIAKGISFLADDCDCLEITGQRLANEVFAAHDFAPGPALIGRYPSGFDEATKAEQRRLTKCAAEVIWKWAERERLAVETSRIFLSHRGVNKALVEKIEHALRDLGLRPWFDKYDLGVGEALVRSVDNAFSECSAAVFFISGDYVDAGVIGNEIERAVHERAIRSEQFKIIPLVLSQHGGDDTRVPKPLETLKWETVADIDILPTILRSLPPSVQSQIRWHPPKR